MDPDDRLAQRGERGREPRIGDPVVLLVGVLREVVEVLLLGRLVPNELERPLHRGETYAVVGLDERHRRGVAVVREKRPSREMRRRPELEEVDDRGREIELRRRLVGDDARRNMPSPAQREARVEGLLVRAEPVEVNAVLVGRKAVIADQDDDRVLERRTLLELVEEGRESSVRRPLRSDEVATVLRRVPGLRDMLRIVTERIMMRRVRRYREDRRRRIARERVIEGREEPRVEDVVLDPGPPHRGVGLLLAALGPAHVREADAPEEPVGLVERGLVRGRVEERAVAHVAEEARKAVKPRVRQVDELLAAKHRDERTERGEVTSAALDGVSVKVVVSEALAPSRVEDGRDLSPTGGRLVRVRRAPRLHEEEDDVWARGVLARERARLGRG